MYSCDKYRPAVNITLPNGVWNIEKYSATGKTRLCETLKRLQRYKEPVFGYSYSDLQYGILLNAELLTGRSVIFLYRCDFYLYKYESLISKFVNDSIILLDCKRFLPRSLDCNLCSIEMTHEKIEVIP